jgi:hypothetical protein
MGAEAKHSSTRPAHKDPPCLESCAADVSTSRRRSGMRALSIAHHSIMSASRRWLSTMLSRTGRARRQRSATGRRRPDVLDASVFCVAVVSWQRSMSGRYAADTRGHLRRRWSGSRRTAACLARACRATRGTCGAGLRALSAELGRRSPRDAHCVTSSASFGRSPYELRWSRTRTPRASLRASRSTLFVNSTSELARSSLLPHTAPQSRNESSSRFTRASSSSFSSKHEIGARKITAVTPSKNGSHAFRWADGQRRQGGERGGRTCVREPPTS